MKKNKKIFKIFLSGIAIFFMVAGFFSFTEKAQAVDATGGNISWSGGYTIHTFIDSGTFVNNVSRTTQVLVVGGGGGGAGGYSGGYSSGGGGGGGYVYNTSYSAAAGSHTVTVGSGGSGTPEDVGNGGNGNNSVFSSITAYGGGGGGYGWNGSFQSVGNDGGCGGGGGSTGGLPAAGGTGSQGGNGGNTPVERAASGGGGASANGGAGQEGISGNGGAGYNNSIDGTSRGFAGGGGGGSGGTSGDGAATHGGGAGGAWAWDSVGGSGADATGGGGGGGAATQGHGGRGGSGIVFVRYLTDNTAPYITSWGTYNTWTTGTTLTFTDAVSMSGGGVRCQFGSWPTDSNPGNSSTSCAVGGNQSGASLYIRVWDWAGNEVTYASGEWYGVYYYLDNTAPGAPGTVSTSWVGDHYVNTNFTISASAASDAHSGVSYYQICRSNDNSSGCDAWMTTNNGNSTSYAVSGGNLPSNGTYRYYHIRAVDAVGNVGSFSSNYVRMDSSGPSTPGIMTTSWAGDHYVKTSFSAATSGSSDGGSGMRGYRLCRSADNASGCSVWTASGEHSGTSETVSGSDLPTNGTYRYYYWYAYDNLGNQSAQSTGEYIRMDSTAPTFSSKTTYSGWYTANQTSTFTYADAISGVASGNNQTCIINTEGSSQTCTLSGAANVCDVAGNCISPNGQVSNGANIDKTVPSSNTISINNGAAATNNPVTTLTLSSTDTNSSLSQMQFSCDNTNFTTAETYGTSKSFNITNAVTGCTMTEGTRSVYVKYKDTAGNWSGSVSDDIIYDATAPTAGTPTIYSGTNNGNQYFLGTISIQSAIADTGSGLNASSCQVNINSGTWTGTGVTQDASYCYYNSYTPGADFTIQFRVADGMGTYGSSTTQSYIFAYLPTVTTQAVSFITSTTAQGNGTIVDAGGENPTRYIEWGITSGIYTDSCDAGTGGAGVYNCPMTELSPGTPYYARAKATNLAGTAYGSEVSFQMNFVYPFRLKGWGIFNGHIRIK